MIMAGASVKVHEDFSFFQRFQKSIKAELLQHHYFCVVIVFFAANLFSFGLYIKSYVPNRQAVKKDAKGKNSLYERNLGNGEKLFTFVIWAE